MTAVLTAAGRAVIGAVLVVACVAAALWSAFGPQGAWADFRAASANAEGQTHRTKEG